jgi:hypothetical protein
MFGRKPKLPLYLALPSIDVDLCLDLEEYAAKVQESLRQAYVAMKKNREVNVERSKLNYDKKVTAANFELEDQIWVLNASLKPGESKKFNRKRKGPCQIKARINDVNYYVKQVEGKGKKLVIHRNRLKKCFVDYRVGSTEVDQAPPQEDRELITLQEPQFIEEVMVPRMESELPKLHSNDNMVVEHEDWIAGLFEGVETMQPVPQRMVTAQYPAGPTGNETVTTSKKRRGRPPKTVAKPNDAPVPVPAPPSSEDIRRRPE